MFQEEIRRALGFAKRGVSVRIVGRAGSGRSTAIREIITELEKTGAEVYSLFGARLLQQTPLAGIASLGLDMRGRHTGPLGMADVLAEQLSQRGSRIIVVDDIDLLDNESLAVLDIAQRRSQRPLIMSMDDSPIYPRTSVLVPERWPEAQVRLPSLRYDQVNQLIAETLSAPADVDVTAHILMKSAGNPRLVVRIAQSGVLNKLLTLCEGEWRMTGHTLWNEDLRGTAEALLQGLEPDELLALDALSMLGTRSVASLHSIVATTMLDRLEGRGLVAVSENIDGELCVASNPPLLVDYFRDNHVLYSRRVLVKRIENVAEALAPAPGNGRFMTPSVAAAVGQLREESGAGGTLAARHFQEQLRVREEAHYEQWEADPSMANSAAFLKFYWGGPIDPERIEHVFAHTVMVNGKAEDSLFFTMTRALWAITRGDDVAAAQGMLSELAALSPQQEAEAEGFGLFLAASYDRMPANLGEILDSYGNAHPQSGVLTVVRAILEVYRFDGLAALKALESTDDFGLASGIEPFVRGLALLVAGRLDEALVFSLNRRIEARRGLDRFGFVANSYVAALALTQSGFGQHADLMMSSVFALGRPGFLASALHDAMLRLVGLRALMDEEKEPASVGAQARTHVADIGPLPGTGKGVFDLFAQRYDDPQSFDASAITLIDAQLDRGFLTEAAYTSVFIMCLLPSREVLERAEHVFRNSKVTSHNQFLAIAEAVVDDDHGLLKVLLDKYRPDADLHAVRLLLKGASKRRLLERVRTAAAAMQQAERLFDGRFPMAGEHLSLNIGHELSPTLSVRETEVAILAGSQTNIEISARLAISLRTVENHISRALKKTGMTTRQALYRYVQGSIRE